MMAAEIASSRGSTKALYLERDRISVLPDQVLGHILSFLTTKEAVATSVLSTKWKYVWASVPDIVFEDHDHGCSLSFQDAKLSFMNFVNRVLVRRRMSCIKKFRLMLSTEYDLANVGAWISSAIACNVREVDLCFIVNNPINLPPSVFSCKTLEVLKLRYGIDNHVPQIVFLPCLKVLQLYSIVCWNNDSINKLLLGCPIIEELVIECVGRAPLGKLYVQSSSLKSFMISTGMHEQLVKLEKIIFSHTRFLIGTVEVVKSWERRVDVDAPNLQYITIRDCLTHLYHMKNLSSLVKADIKVERSYYSRHIGERDFGDNLLELLRGISNVQFMSLSCSTLQFLSWARDALPMFQNLVHLEVEIDRDNLKVFLNILERCPKLEVLVYRLMHPYPCLPKCLPMCLRSSLKAILVEDFDGMKDKETLWVKFFLENALSLRKMSINSRYSNTPSSVLKELFMFPRASTTCQVAFS